MTYRLGVDLGTTYTAAAVGTASGPSMIGLGNRSLQIPSVLFLTEENTFLVGETAERRGLGQPDRVVREFKRRIGDTVPILIAGTPFSPQALTSRLLEHVIGTAGERMGGPPGQVVLTHPANWGPYKLELFDQVARLANVADVRLCPEPLAAAAQYAAQTRVPAGETIAVYDLGGGTFDACVLQKTETGFVQLGTPEGIEHLGGVDFDEALFQHVLGLLGERLSDLDPDDPETTVGLSRLRRECVEVKEALSADTDAVLPVSLPGLSSTLRLTRSEFENLIRPSLSDTVGALDRAIRSAGVPADRLHAIVLVGGSSRIPLIGELLHQAFGTPTAMDTHPKHDIALGSVQLDAEATGTGTLPAPGGWPASTLEPPTVRTVRADPVPAAGAIPAAGATPAGPQSGPLPGPPLGTPSAGAGGSPPGNPPSSPTGVGSASSGVPDPASGGSRRRRTILIGAGAAAVVAGIVIGIAVATSGQRTGTQAEPSPFDTRQPSTPAASSISPLPSPSPSASPSASTPAGLPRSAPIEPTQMLIQLETDGKNDIWLADTTTSRPVRRLTTSAGSNWAPEISPGFDAFLYLHSDPDGKGTTVRVAGIQQLQGDRELFALPRFCQEPGRPARPAWNAADPTMLAIPCVDTDDRYAIALMRTDGSFLRRVDAPDGRPRIGDVAFTADGRRVAFWAAPQQDRATGDGGVLYTVPVGGGRPEPIIRNEKLLPSSDADLDFSPDGRYVAFRRLIKRADGKPQGDIFRARVDGTEVTRLTDDPADEQNPSWSRDSRQISYKSGQNSPFLRIWVMTVDGDARRPLYSTSSVGAQALSSWSPR